MLEKLNCYVKRLGIFLITAALITGMAGCLSPRSQDLEIRTWYDLDAIRNNLSGHHILMNDLDSTTAGYEELASPTANEGQGWQPIIGTGGDPPFTGTFDGQGYEIRDLFINLPGKGYVGLFSIVGEGGRIEDTGLLNVDVTSNAYVGGLVGSNWGTVSSSYSTGSVTSDYGVGGLAGGNVGTVSNSYSTSSITGEEGVGGLMGANSGTVSNSYSSGSVTGENYVGGLVGDNQGEGTVSNSYSTGSVSGNEDVGGLVGRNYEGTVSNAFWDKETSGIEVSDGGTGKTTEEMKSIDPFTAWDIIAVTSGQTNPTYTWNIVDDETYPFLSWQ